MDEELSRSQSFLRSCWRRENWPLRTVPQVGLPGSSDSRTTVHIWAVLVVLCRLFKKEETMKLGRDYVGDMAEAERQNEKRIWSYFIVYIH